MAQYANLTMTTQKTSQLKPNTNGNKKKKNANQQIKCKPNIHDFSVLYKPMILTATLCNYLNLKISASKSLSCYSDCIKVN